MIINLQLNHLIIQLIMQPKMILFIVIHRILIGIQIILMLGGMMMRYRYLICC